MKKSLLIILSICTIVLGCDVLSGNKSLQNELLGTWEGMYPQSNAGNFTGVEYTFNPDGSYLETYSAYNSSRKLIGYFRLTLGNYSVEKNTLTLQANERYRAEGSIDLPKTVEALKNQEPFIILSDVCDVNPACDYGLKFSNEFRLLQFLYPASTNGFPLPPLTKKENY